MNNDDFDILFTNGGPTNYVFNKRLNDTIDLSESTTTVPQLPQISFGLTSGKTISEKIVLIHTTVSSYRPDQCTHRFPNVQVAEGSGQGNANKVTTRLFPDLRFGCRGNLVRFTVALVDRTTGEQSPKIQIWRPNDTQPCVYYKPGPDIPIVRSSSVCLRDRFSGGIFQCTLNETFQVQVQPGDILGLELPPENDDDLDIYFTDKGPVNYVFEDRLDSTTNLSEAHKFTSHLPQINFVVILGNILNHNTAHIV